MRPLRRGAKLPEPVRRALELSSGERVLSWAKDAAGVTVVATTHRLCAVGGAESSAASGGSIGADSGGQPGAGVLLARPWHHVDAGSWSAELGQLTVTWVDGSRPAQWVLGDDSLLPETVRERVQASVVLSQRVEAGPRRSARAVIRQDLATGELLEQVVLGRGVRADDPEVASMVETAMAYLREQVGL